MAFSCVTCVCQGHTDGGGAKAGGGVDRSPGDQSPGGRHHSSRTRGARLWRENGGLQEQLRGSQELNATLQPTLGADDMDHHAKGRWVCEREHLRQKGAF